MSDWVEVDRAPDAADGTPVGLQLDERGITLHTDERLVVAPWALVFGAERIGRRLFVMVPRQAPQPPWIMVEAEHLPADLRAGGLEGLERTIEARLSRRGLRDAGPRRAPIDPQELQRAVLARHVIPGAVEVPVGGAAGRAKVTWPMILAGPPCFAATVYAASWYVGAAVYMQSRAAMVVTSIMVLVSSLLAAITLIGLALVREGRMPAVRRRVLVMTPDGFVIGTRRGIAAHRWSDVSRFERQGPALAVIDPDGRAIATVEAKWFGAPMQLIVAVATAYRERVGRP